MSGRRVDWAGVEAVLFDVDGTLFDHLAIRPKMVRTMSAAMLRRTLRPGDVRLLRAFRMEREQLALEELPGVAVEQYARPAARIGRTAHDVAMVVERWIEREPLAFVRGAMFPDVGEFVRSLQARGVRTAVFSDYPAEGKLAKLDVHVDVVRHAAASDVDRLKPHPAGYLRVAELVGAAPARCLVIGDRDDRDGIAAARARMAYLRKVSTTSDCRGEFSSYRSLIDDLNSAHA